MCNIREINFGIICEILYTAFGKNRCYTIQNDKLKLDVVLWESGCGSMGKWVWQYRKVSSYSSIHHFCCFSIPSVLTYTFQNFKTTAAQFVITGQDMNSLEPECYLNDQIINFFLR